MPVSAPTSPTHVILFDGDCGLCHHTVQFLMRHDRDGRFGYVPQQSPEGQKVLARVGFPAEPSSVIVINSERVFTHSAAVIEIYRTLGGWYAVIARLLALVPRPIRDFGYRVVARWRYNIFGRAQSCRLPSVDGRV